MGDPTGDTAPMRPHAFALTEPARDSGEASGEPTRGSLIGRFVALDVLGAGGMGIVYAAYDPHLDRKVAVKILRTEATSSAGNVRTRLLREAQAMARIDHPNVIKVHEVDTYEDGVFVAMEFADGGTLRTWLERRHALRDTLAVFVQAGRGLAAAHAAGLVHRDFKPENVLLTKHGTARVTDFGLVSEEAVEPHDTEPVPRATPLSLELTRTGSVMGTPPYMAPEQFASRAATARTDQFAFCVALYEAVYGARPFAGTTFEELSENVTAGKLVTPATHAAVPGWLRRVLVRGLATDPAARFPAMDALLAELTRGETLRRRRTIALVALPILAAGGATAYAMWPSTTACNAGSSRFASVWNPARHAQLGTAFSASGRPHAAASLARVGEIVDAWGRDWQAGYVAACMDTRVHHARSEHALDIRMDCLDQRLGELNATLSALAHGGTDVVDHSIDAVLRLPLVTPCADIPALEAAVTPPDTAEARARVAVVRAQLDDVVAQVRLGRIVQARTLATAVVDAARATGYRPIVATTLVELGRLQHNLSDHAALDTLREAMHEAGEAGDRALEIDAISEFVWTSAGDRAHAEVGLELAMLAEASAGSARPAPETLVALRVAHAVVEQKLGKLADAHTRLENTLAYAEQAIGPGHVVNTTREALGSVLEEEGRYGDARVVFERVLADRERLYGKDHPDVAAALSNLAVIAHREDKLDDALQLQQRALAIRIAAYGASTPEVAASYVSLGSVAAESGDQATAESYYRKALAIWGDAADRFGHDIAHAKVDLGEALYEQNRLDEARSELERAEQLFETSDGPEAPSVAVTLTKLAMITQRHGDLPGALEQLRRAERIATHAYGPDHPMVAGTIINEAVILREENKLVEAQAALDRGIGVIGRVFGADHPRMATTLSILASIQAERHDYKVALASYEKAIAIMEKRLGKDYPELVFSLLGAGHCLDELGRPGEAVPYLERALAVHVKANDPPYQVAPVHFELAHALLHSPATRARAIAEANEALAAFTDGNHGDDVAEVRTWLAGHR